MGYACIPVLMFSSNNCKSKRCPAACAGNNYKLVWQDEFNGNTLDEKNNWVVEDNGSGNGNAELQYYKRGNISVGIEPASGEKCMFQSRRIRSGCISPALSIHSCPLEAVNTS